jgi:hypothetical protein
MWPITYEERLLDWNRLRQQSNNLELPQQLLEINNWWMRAPIVNRTILWDDTTKWPDPWQLLNNSGYCELARALGIVYTLMLLDTPLYTNLKIINNSSDNLVLVDDGKYILNWAVGEMLNTHSTPITTVKNMIDSSELESFLQ